jgi:hopanoid C-2 methylase
MDLPESSLRRVLIVNCYFPETREAIRLPGEVPNALAPVLLAGAFARERCQIILHNEVSDGFLEIYRPELLGWPELVVFSGLSAAFDRMLHLTAYLRTQNPRVRIAAGGLAIRSLPRYAQRFFDYVCDGDAEQIVPVIEDVLGRDCVADTPTPRYDLAHWIGHGISYAESSRNCNFRCGFCSVTAHGERYRPLDIEHLRSQVLAMGHRRVILLGDNQFHGGTQRSFRERVGLLRELRAERRFDHWAAFVTDAFFWDARNLELARDAGCFALFVGVESFDTEWLRKMNKTVNSRHSQVELIQRCLEHGILFQYGLVFDPTERRIADVHREIATICADARVPLPNFIFLSIPLPGTPFFRECWKQGLLLPHTKMRDLEGSTLSLRSLDASEDVARFLGSAKNLRGFRARALAHHARHLWQYRRSLSAAQGLVSSITAASILAPQFTSNPRTLLARRRPRTHISTTDRLDDVYIPRLPVAPEYRDHFTPTWITDAAGQLNPALAEDLLAQREPGRAAS